MATNYPASLDTFDSIASDKKTSDVVGGRTHRDMHNDLADAVEAVQAELGTDPAGAYATVKARFEAIEGATLPAVDAKGDLIVGTADNTYDNVTVGANNTVLVADSGQTAGVKWSSTVGTWTVAGLRVGYTAKTGAYTATTSDDIINVTSGTFTLDLPAASTCSGKTLKVKNTGTGIVTLDGNSTETIEGVLTFPLGPGSYVEITSTGSVWILTGGVPETGWRDISASLNTGVAKSASSGAAAICRVGDVVQVHFNVTISAGSVTQLTSGALTTGFRPSSKIPIGIVGVSTASSADAALGTTAALGYYAQTSPIRLTASAPNPGTVTWTATWITDDTWPTSLPGTAA